MFQLKVTKCAILLGVFLTLVLSPGIASETTLTPDNSIECSIFVEDYRITGYPWEADVHFWLFNVTSDEKISQLTFKVVSLSEELGNVRARDEYDFISVKVLESHKVKNIPKLANYYMHTLQIEFDNTFENGFGRRFIHLWYHATVSGWIDNYTLMLYIPIYLENTNVRDHGTVIVSGQGIEINFEAPDDIIEADYSDYSLSDDNSHLNVFYFDNKLDTLTESSGYILEVSYKASLAPKQIWDQYIRIEEILRSTKESLQFTTFSLYVAIIAIVVSVVLSYRYNKKIARTLSRELKSIKRKGRR